MKLKRHQVESQIAKMRSDFELEEQSVLRDTREMELQEKQIAVNRAEMGRARKADAVPAHGNGRS